VEAISLNDQNILIALKENAIHRHSKTEDTSTEYNPHRLVRAIDRRSSTTGEWQQRLRLGLEVVDGEGVDIVKLWTQAIFLEVVARLEVLGRWQSMMTSLRK
jgi:hypothetical protein